MFDNKENDQDLTALKARLASLRPRADRLDPEWRAMLEKEMALTLALSQRERGRCESPAGHRFVCVHCGNEARIFTRRRWPWPAALAAVSGVAAVLLVMLVTQRGPQHVTAGSPGSANNTSRVTGVVESAWQDAPAGARGDGDNLAGPVGRRTLDLGVESLEWRESEGPFLSLGKLSSRQYGPGAREDAMSYLCLREQVLRHGVEWLDRPVPRVSVPAAPTEGPLTNRELLNRLIEEQGLRGS
jgi:hypothetical protein